jgi:3-methyladenine DNA glycosylase AlkC
MKDLFNVPLIELTAQHIQKHFSEFDQQGFIRLASDDIENRELKDRANQVCIAFTKYLPSNYSDAIDVLLNTLQAVETNQELTGLSSDSRGLVGWIILPMSQYVGEQGQSDLAISMSALKAMTKRFSSEFGIRYFLLAQPKASLDILTTWLDDECHHVRRLISEGTRPLLPWAMQLPEFKQNPEAILPLLEALKDDESEYVRRSVANNLNDIAKNQPDLVADIAGDWLKGASKNRQRLVKHACRTLIKQGHTQTLSHFGYHPVDELEVSLSLDKQQVDFGEHQGLNLTIKNKGNTTSKVLLDYVIHHQKANGKLAPKVFKWKTFELAAGEKMTLTKNHAFKLITTRRYYTGEHKVAVKINGTELEAQSFDLIME